MDELEQIRKKKMEKLMKRMEGPKMEIEASDNNFAEKIIEQSKKTPVVVDFWADWCAPCRMLGPTLEKLAKEYNGKFILVKVNVEHARSAAQTHSIMSIPNVKLFKDGKVVDEFVGALPESDVREWLDKNIK